MNNKGSSYLMVIICISFISLLSVVMLSLTVTNAETKRINKESKANFYSLEQVVDEIYTNIGIEVMKLLELSYSETLANAIAKDEDGNVYIMKSNDVLAQKCKEALSERIAKKYNDDIGTFKIDVLKDYMITLQSAGNEPTLTLGEFKYDSETVRFNGLKVTYVNAGYENSITTDIVIDLPEIDFSLGSRSTVGEYPVFSGLGLTLGSNVSARIIGNLIVGSDIALNNVESKLELKNKASEQNFIAVGGDIRVAPGNVFSSQAGGRYSNLSIWCENIITEGSSVGIANVNMSGVVYVKDDLELNVETKIYDNPNTALNKVKITGDYYGYSYSDAVGSDSESSAIIVNSMNSELDLSDLGNLYVAGTAYIDVDDEGIVTGESVALKGNQDIYLVPVDCITVNTKPVVSNPFSASLLADVDGVPVENRGIKIEFTPEFIQKVEEGIGEAFGNIITGDKSKTVSNILLGENLVYTYLDFSSKEAAAKYFRFMNDNHSGSLSFVESSLSRFKVAEVRLPLDGIKTTGIATSVEKDGYGNVQTVSLPTSLTDSGLRESIRTEIVERYNEVVDLSNYFNTDKVTGINDDLLITIDGIGTITRINPSLEAIPSTAISDAKSIIIITKGDLSTSADTWWKEVCSLVPSEIDGIIISKGNVDISFTYNREFNGLIYAGGNLTILRPIGGTSDVQEINVDYSVINNLLDRYGTITYNGIDGEQSIEDLFKYVPNSSTFETSGGSMGRYSYKDFIYFENWRKK